MVSGSRDEDENEGTISVAVRSSTGRGGSPRTRASHLVRDLVGVQEASHGVRAVVEGRARVVEASVEVRGVGVEDGVARASLAGLARRDVRGDARVDSERAVEVVSSLAKARVGQAVPAGDADGGVVEVRAPSRRRGRIERLKGRGERVRLRHE